MKIIIIGLGNFGRSLALNLTDNGHEVFGVDHKMEKVDLLKDRIANVVCMDANNELAYKVLPIQQANLGIVAIGENEGASIVTTAILKKYKNLRIVSRSLSTIHDTILEAMGINDVIHPEQDAAYRLTKQISFNYALDYFRVDNKHSIAEVFSPYSFSGKSVKSLKLTQKYSVSLITVIREIKNFISLNEKSKKKVIGLVTGDTILQKGDILTIFGSNKSIMNFLKDKLKNPD
ncbi:potassium channel family protein [Blattabacterium punctulatus]|uniref:TrkA family potassium uptake protein n=1 Tax=Blattabacterium punctulatus TaxID=164514 RepID=A0ABN5M689_9FLAO|nr:TrkA family potassium uptake protein [Blattabacterium punctulatus]AWU40050.1 TrkA family potassium uptake protein [Blattabacterium punctulatus]AWU40592.1 TrkA family potassium uptake protein [Blattabacterium punctulatus]AWU45050.1 TrkA family potassium uptake protein [Blattabacterium punctulatus]